jgi:hypothetical protein
MASAGDPILLCHAGHWSRESADDSDDYYHRVGLASDAKPGKNQHVVILLWEKRGRAQIDTPLILTNVSSSASLVRAAQLLVLGWITVRNLKGPGLLPWDAQGLGRPSLLDSQDLGNRAKCPDGGENTTEYPTTNSAAPPGVFSCKPRACSIVSPAHSLMVLRTYLGQPVGCKCQASEHLGP